MAKKQSKYHRRPDGLLETTRTDKCTGKRIHFYGHTDREIDDQIMAFSAVAERGRLFKEVAEEWRDLHFPTLAPNTLKGYRPAYRRAVEEFGDDPIRQIRPQDVKRFITDFSRGSRAKKTVTNQLLILSLIFGYAVENGDINYSPCDHVTIPKNLPKGHRDAASPENEATVKASADIWLFPYFILYTGLRKGEALALTWGDIDLERREINVCKSVYHEGDRPYIKEPKTAAGVRIVPLLDPLLEALPTPGQPEEYVFSDDGLSPLTNRRYQTLWTAYAKETGITCTAHQLRHSYATILSECKVDVKDAQYLLGHSTIAMTQDVYTHLREARRKKTALSLNERIKAAEAGAMETAQPGGET